jgi:hypothetical protein
MRCVRPILILVATGLFGGCAGTNGASPLTASLSVEPSAAAASTTVLPLGNTPSVKGTPIAVYERVARGVLNCWFGALGPLKKTHIFNADTTPPSKGGAAEIAIHEREANPLPNQSPRGARVFRVILAREAEEVTRVSVEGGKLPSDLARAMEIDTVAWATEKESCEAQVVRPAPPPPPEPEKAKVKKRAKTAQR